MRRGAVRSKQADATTSIAVSRPGDAQERAAEAAATDVLAGRQAQLGAVAPSSVQRFAAAGGVAPAAVAKAAAVTVSGGQPLAARDRAFFEPRFGRDFSGVRLHTGAEAGEAACGIGAEAYTHRNSIAFAPGAYRPESQSGRRLLAHELAHTVQQADSGEGQLQRACTPSAVCSAPSIPGSPEDFGESEEARELRARTRRQGMTPRRARSSGHAGRAAQLETVLRDHSASQMGLLHGIFVDADLSRNTAAMVWGCDQWMDESLPAGDPDPDGFAAAAKPCMFVPGHLNREALQFNTGRARVGGEPRDAWHRETLLTVVHEAEHVRFDDYVEPGLSLPGAVSSASCTQAAVADPLSEIVAIMSEFKILNDAASGEADLMGPLHQRLNTFLDDAVSQPGENFTGALTAMGCACDCGEVDALLIQSVDAMTAGWTAAEKSKFRTEIQTRMPGGTRPSWPAAPSP